MRHTRAMDAHNSPLPDQWADATLAISAGRPHQPGSPLNTPIVPATAFRAEEVGGYSRDSNPTWEAFEAVVGALEGGQALAFASGMGAIAAALEVTLMAAVEGSGPGRRASGAPVVAAPDVQYSGTRGLLSELLRGGRIQLRSYHPADGAEALAAAAAADVLVIETPANPSMEISDITALAGATRGLTVADNTFATPLATRPLDLGVDIVVHSASKYLAGHSDSLLGIAVSRDSGLTAALHSHRALHGATPGVLEAFLATRGVRTMPLRVRAASANAMTVAERLAARADIAEVRYPGLPGDPGHAVALTQMSSFGSVVAFRPAGGRARADAIVRATRLWTHATSLGGIESTLERRRCHEFESPEVPAELVRLSVGCEDVEDLWNDLSAALEATAAVVGD